MQRGRVNSYGFIAFISFLITLTSNDILLGIMSGNLSLIFDCPIICKTIDQSDNSSQHVLGFLYLKI